LKQLDIHLSTELLKPIEEWCKNNTEFAPVVTKFNKQGQWTAISLKGYSSDPNQIGKGGVLGTTGVDELQTTPLYDLLNIDKILEHIPAETERVRLMKLKAGTKISKHTDKVDKDIKSGKVVRLHIPVITNNDITMKTWLTEGLVDFKMSKGECWWLDVARPHAVENNSDIDRVHLVIDVYNNENINV